MTLAAFFKLKETYWKNNENILENGENIIYGIGSGFVENKDYHWNYKYSNNNNNINNNNSNGYYDYGNETTNIFYNYLFMNNPFFSQNNYSQNDQYFRGIQVANYNNFLNNQQFPFNLNNNNSGEAALPNLAAVYKNKNIKNK